MDMPPSRYKVVEQGRRLVVLDSWNGDAPVTGHAAAPSVPIAAARPATVDQARAALRRPEPGHRSDVPAPRPMPAAASGETGILVTQSWFDDEAPRRVRLDQDKLGAAAMLLLAGTFAAVVGIAMFGWPALLVAGFLLLQKGTRGALRGGMTKWLDTMEQLGPG